jgi:PTS system nitrogen regulatory IIA component
MNIIDLVGAENVVVGLRVANKTRALAELSRRAAQAVGLDEQAIADALGAREAMGSTGVGQGVAIPHARIAGLDRFYGLFIRLQKPIDFAAVDDQPVDLVFLLLTPEKSSNDHLAALACISRRLRDPAVASRLRAAKDAATLYQILSTP